MVDQVIGDRFTPAMRTRLLANDLVAAFSEQFIEAAERHYIGVLSVKVIEMRLHSPEKR